MSGNSYERTRSRSISSESGCQSFSASGQSSREATLRFNSSIRSLSMISSDLYTTAFAAIPIVKGSSFASVADSRNVALASREQCAKLSRTATYQVKHRARRITLLADHFLAPLGYDPFLMTLRRQSFFSFTSPITTITARSRRVSVLPPQS